MTESKPETSARDPRAAAARAAAAPSPARRAGSEPARGAGGAPAARAPSEPRRRAGAGPDRVSVLLFSLAAFLLVLALLGTQLAPTLSGGTRGRALLVRRIYRTTVIERVIAGGAAGGASVSRSVSGAGPEPALPPIPVSRTS
jgi:hypothetical protein